MAAESFLSQLLFYVQDNFWAILQQWWWLFLIIECFWLGKAALYWWYFWKNELFAASLKQTLLEIRIPEEVLEPIKAMETVLTGFWQIYKLPNWYEKWWEGQSLMDFALEIACIDGVPHFYVRMPKDMRNLFESHIYSQYPQAEIFPAEDYAKNVPQDIPNADWDLWGTDYKRDRENAYPIKTYIEFETGKEIEEKRIDPIASLLEAMAKLRPGEQLWVQILAIPQIEEIEKWITEGKKIRDELARRDVNGEKSLPMLQEAAEILFLGKVKEPKQEKKEFIPVEMKLTPGEKEVIAALERKIGKPGFLCMMRYIYLGKKEVFFKPNLRLAMSYFTNFATNNMNQLIPYSNTITKIKMNWYDWFWFTDQRLFVRKRRIFRLYRSRDGAHYPKYVDITKFVLTAEELASLYHFPGRIVAQAPTLPRVEAKKGEPPPELPVG